MIIRGARTVLVACMLVIGASLAFGGDLLRATKVSLIQGSYVKYYYRRPAATYLVSVVYTGGSQIFAVYRNLSDPEEWGQMVFDYHELGDVRKMILDSRGARMDQPSHMLIQTLMMNLMCFYSDFYTLDYGPFESKILYDDFYGKNKLYYRFDKWLPVFNLYGIYVVEAKKYLFEAVAAGILASPKDGRILLEDVPSPSGKGLPFYRISPQESAPAEMNGVTILLDKNWVLRKRSVAGLDGYWIPGNGGEDAGVSAFTLKGGTSSEALLEAFAMAVVKASIVPSSVKVQESQGVIRQSYEMVELSGATPGMRTGRSLFAMHGESVDALALSVRSSVYRVNRNYFEGIVRQWFSRAAQ